MITKSGLGRSLRFVFGGAPSPPAVTAFAALGLLVLGLGLGGAELRAQLRLEGGGIADGQLWRLATGHLVHLGWRHALLNLAGVLLVAMLFAGRLRPWQWVLVVLASAAAIDAGLLLVEQVGWYVGLSGVLHGAFAAGALASLRAGEREGWMLATLLLGKLVWEQWVGPLPLTERSAGGPVLVDSHLYGALGGFAAAASMLLRRRPS